jgi:hypothetical protein
VKFVRLGKPSSNGESESRRGCMRVSDEEIWELALAAGREGEAEWHEGEIGAR